MREQRRTSPAPFPAARPLRTYVAVLLYLAGFAVLLVVVSRVYLIPALQAAGVADPRQKKELAANAWLILAVVLFVLFAGLVVAFRVGRFFFPRPAPPRRTPTQYTDAWAESARRMQTPPGEGPEE